MKSVIVVFITAVALLESAQAEDTKDVILREAGVLAGQLLDYEWQTEGRQSVSPTNALVEFNYWVNATVAGQFGPPPGTPLGFHPATGETCDAIRMAYETNGLSITIIQTRVTMLLAMKGAEAAIADMKAAQGIATRIADRVIIAPSKAIPVLTSASNGFCIGEPKHFVPQKPIANPSEIRMAEGFLLDHWWSNGKEIVFYGVKAPYRGPGGYSNNALIRADMKDVKHNRVWF